jgi:hypothetical protein
MTKFTVITFGTAEFSWALRVQKRHSLRFGAHRHIAYDVASAPVLRARSENAPFSLNPRGYGLWIWKPYIMLDAISRCDPDEYIIYLDAGVAPVADMSPWFAQLGRSAINLFAPVPPRALRQWAKRECFVRMQADTPDYHGTAILSAGIQAYRNAPESRAFITELQQLMRDPRLLEDSSRAAGSQEDGSFVAHRHDQSILTLLAKLRGCLVLREPSQYGIWTAREREAYIAAGSVEPGLLNEECPQVLDVHRGRNRANVLVRQLWRTRRRFLAARRGSLCV